MSGFDGGHRSECGGTDGMHYSDCSYDGTVLSYRSLSFFLIP